MAISPDEDFKKRRDALRAKAQGVSSPVRAGAQKLGAALGSGVNQAEAGARATAEAGQAASGGLREGYRQTRPQVVEAPPAPGASPRTRTFTTSQGATGFEKGAPTRTPTFTTSQGATGFEKGAPTTPGKAGGQSKFQQVKEGVRSAFGGGTPPPSAAPRTGGGFVKGLKAVGRFAGRTGGALITTPIIEAVTPIAEKVFGDVDPFDNEKVRAYAGFQTDAQKAEDFAGVNVGLHGTPEQRAAARATRLRSPDLVSKSGVNAELAAPTSPRLGTVPAGTTPVGTSPVGTAPEAISAETATAPVTEVAQPPEQASSIRERAGIRQVGPSSFTNVPGEQPDVVKPGGGLSVIGKGLSPEDTLADLKRQVSEAEERTALRNAGREDTAQGRAGFARDEERRARDSETFQLTQGGLSSDEAARRIFSRDAKLAEAQIGAQGGGDQLAIAKFLQDQQSQAANFEQRQAFQDENLGIRRGQAEARQEAGKRTAFDDLNRAINDPDPAVADVAYTQAVNKAIEDPTSPEGNLAFAQVEKELKAKSGEERGVFDELGSFFSGTKPNFSSAIKSGNITMEEGAISEGVSGTILKNSDTGEVLANMDDLSENAQRLVLSVIAAKRANQGIKR